MIDQATIDEFLDLACLTYSPHESPRRIQQAIALLNRYPDLATSSIHTAAASGSTATTAAFLKENPNLVHEIGGPRAWPPLMYLCYGRIPEKTTNGDSLAVARMLLEHGADPNSHYMWDDTYRFTALTGAIGEGERGTRNQPPHEHAMDLAVLLLDAGANPNDAQGLYNSMFEESNRWIELLLSRGLSREHKINWVTDNPTRTLDFVLGHATKCGFTERVTLLLEQGADANSANHYDNRSHLAHAILNGFGDVAKVLEQYGAKPVEFSPEDTFRRACMNVDVATARLMLSKHQSLLEGSSLLHDAASNGLTNVVELLIDLGADVDAFDGGGATPLHRAAWRGRIDVARTLIGHGAKSLKDKTHGDTPVGWADYAGQAEVHGFLLEQSETMK